MGEVQRFISLYASVCCMCRKVVEDTVYGFFGSQPRNVEAWQRASD